MHRSLSRWIVFITALLVTIPAAAQSTCGESITVITGDTLTAIASRCNTTVEELIRLNPGSESQINTGDIIRLPTYAPASQPPVVSVWPLSGGPGTELTVTVNGFPPYTELIMRIGSTSSGTADLTRVITTEAGAVTTPMTIPSTAQRGETYIIVVETPDFRFSARSYGIPVNFSTSRLIENTSIYLVDLGDRGANGIPIACNDSLVPYSIPIEPTVAPLTAALRHLLASSTRFYGSTDLYNALNPSDLFLSNIVIENQEAKIDLIGQLLVADSCDAQRVYAQLTWIALQYPTVDTVSITVNDMPLEGLLGIARATDESESGE